MTGPRRYQKKPLVIEAMRFTGHNYDRISSWMGDAARDIHSPGGTLDLYIDTLEGTLHVSPGDYVIKGVQGEFYPCKPDIFEATYDLAEGEPRTLLEVFADDEVQRDHAVFGEAFATLDWKKGDE